MRPMEFAKRTAANKAIDYFMEDPVPRIESMMTKIDKMLPDALFPSQRKAFAKAIEGAQQLVSALVPYRRA